MTDKIFSEHSICSGSDFLPEQTRWDGVQGWCDVCGKWLPLTGTYTEGAERRLPGHGRGTVIHVKSVSQT